MVVARENRSDRRRTTRSASVRSILALAGGAAALPLAELPVDAALLAAGDHNGSTFYQHERFLAVVRGQGVPEVTLADGAKAVAIGLAAQESAMTGQAVTL